MIRNWIRRTSLIRAKEYFTVENGSLVLSHQLFEDLNLDTNCEYTVGVGFAGTTDQIINLVKLNVVNTTIQDGTNNKPNTNNGNENTVKPKDGSITDKEDITVESKPVIEQVQDNNVLPNTGAPIGGGAVSILGLITTFIGTRLFRRKK